MTLYKHLVYVDFVSFIRQSWTSYLKDTWEFFTTLDQAKTNPQIGYTLQRGIKFSMRKWFTTVLHTEMLLFKHIQNRFCFNKTKHFMFQRVIFEHIQIPASKCAIPENIQYFTKLYGTPQEFYCKKPRPMEIPHDFSLITDGNSTFF